MFGLFAKVVIRVIAGGVAYAAVRGVYKRVTKDVIRDEVNEEILDNDAFKEAFKAKVKEKSENNDTVTVDILDEMDEPLGDIEISGDEIAEDIYVGDEIILRETD